MYKGLETGSRDVVSHAVKQNQIVFVFQSALTPDNYDHGNHLMRHGDGVKDVAFSVNNLELVVEKARAQGATIIKDIWSESDEQGTVRMASIQTVGVS
jgi:4-hydroxyphenylpyruvate dioxygenase